MANLSITLKCNRKCSYCFGRSMGKKMDIQTSTMSRATFLQALDFLRRSGIDQVRLLGGEPTLHPDFEWFVQQSLARGFRLLIFSNGLMPRAALHCLEQTCPEKVAVLINTNAPNEKNHLTDKRQPLAFSRLGKRVSIGFTIFQPKPNLDFILSLIDKHQLNRAVRLGLAHPSMDGANTFLYPKNYSAVGLSITEFAYRAAKCKVSMEFDCGFVPCMFPDDLFRLPGVNIKAIGSQCGPVPDILPDGSVVPCCPLALPWRFSSIDGKILASGSYDKTIKLWALPEGKLLKALEEHKYRVNALAISPDGKILASGSSDKTIKLWALPEDKLLKTLEGHKEIVNALVISPDGKVLASGSSDKTIKLWALPEGKFNTCLIDLKANTKRVKGVQYKVRNEFGEWIIYTLPCGSPIPPGAVCVCNCVPGSWAAPASSPPATAPSAPRGGGQHCTCVPVHYWHPN